jgi:hypothetical protein
MGCILPVLLAPLKYFVSPWKSRVSRPKQDESPQLAAFIAKAFSNLTQRVHYTFIMGSIEKQTETNNDSTVDVSIALRANDLKNVPSLASEIASLGSTVVDGDYHARHALLRKARALVTALETPRETMIKHNWAEVSPLPRQWSAMPSEQS